MTIEFTPIHQKAKLTPLRLLGVAAGQQPAELIAADRLFMCLSCDAMPSAKMGVEIKTPEECDDIIEMLVRARDFVWPKESR